MQDDAAVYMLHNEATAIVKKINMLISHCYDPPF